MLGRICLAMTDYLLQSEAAQRWVPEVGPVYAAQSERSPDRAVHLVLLLASGRADRLSGRCLHVTQDVAALVQNADAIEREDRYILRFVE